MHNTFPQFPCAHPTTQTKKPVECGCSKNHVNKQETKDVELQKVATRVWLDISRIEAVILYPSELSVRLVSGGTITIAVKELTKVGREIFKDILDG
jgi:hypothetical protein